MLALKENQELFCKEVQAYFDEGVLKRLKTRANCYEKTTEKEHGGIAVREYYISEETNWYSQKETWNVLKSFGMVYKTLTKWNGKVELE